MTTDDNETTSGTINENEWKRIRASKIGDAVLWNELGQFRKALIKIGKNESLMALSLASK